MRNRAAVLVKPWISAEAILESTLVSADSTLLMFTTKLLRRIYSELSLYLADPFWQIINSLVLTDLKTVKMDIICRELAGLKATLVTFLVSGSFILVINF